MVRKFFTKNGQPTLVPKQVGVCFIAKLFHGITAHRGGNRYLSNIYGRPTTRPKPRKSPIRLLRSSAWLPCWCPGYHMRLVYEGDCHEFKAQLGLASTQSSSGDSYSVID